MGELILRLLPVLLAFILGLLFQQYRQARSEDIQLISDHISDLDNLKNRAEDYWLLGNECNSQAPALAAKTRAAHSAALLFLDDIAEEVLGTRYPEYVRLATDLADQALGGKFDQADREFDPVRATDTLRTITEMVHLLRLARREAMSIERLASDLLKSSIDFTKAAYQIIVNLFRRLWK